jgi:glycosyltransferase involved in cell wall biosynthesis/2-polyprenyl-3-methyl-5-hydroxy-6-metoxy-1,4-benzoquinol methylase
VRILVEAFACRPGSGSEDANGWSYPHEFARRGHDVTVITSPEARAAIDAALSADPCPGLRFVYVSRRSWPLRLGWTVGSAVRYVIWLWEAAEVGRRLDAEAPFDVLHHAGYGTLLGGSFLWRVGRPLVFGPAGGGQTTPSAFRPLFGTWWRTEALRTCVVRHLWRSVWHARQTVRRAEMVLASNEETLLLARRMGAGRARLFQDGALPEALAPTELPERPPHEAFRLLWLGRIMPRKAVELAVLAVEGLPAGDDITLTIIGRGANEQMEADFRSWLAGRRRASGRVTAPGAVPFSEVPAAYLAADAFVFTSVRDTIGVQVLEAMAFGLPVVCLDHQGVRTLVPEDGGIKVPVTDVEGTVQALRAAILELANDPERCREMGRANYTFARSFTWERHAEGLLAAFEEAAARSGGSRAYARGHDVAQYRTTNGARADEVDDFAGERYAQFARRLPPGTRRVLDLGCATGRGGEVLIAAFPGLELDGLDVLEERLVEARRRGYAGTFCVSATDIPVADAAYDAVVSGEMLEHLHAADVDRVLEEVRRVLRPGGVALLTTPNPHGVNFVLRRRSVFGHSHLSAHTAQSLSRRLRRHGFDRVAVWGSGRATRLVGERLPLLSVYGSYLIGARRA